MAKLTLGQEAYYEQQVAAGADDYYAGRGESPGLWAGTGAPGLGLVGVVQNGELGALLRGVSPATRERLRAPVRERTITVRRLDVETGEWREEQKRLAPVCGYDLVFSCPKSVSVLHALTADERVRREISDAHESAWQVALAYLEREACVVRRGRGGAVREHGGGFVAAAFRHRTSRAQDPHLHTHVIVANMSRAADGKWRALDGEAILKTYRLAAGYLYEAQLRHELTERLGLEWTEPSKGMAELARLPKAAVRAFSTRRRSLVEHMEALGTEGFAAARVAALATRERKEQVDLPRLRQQWLARAGEHGLGPRDLRRLIDESPRRADPEIDREQLAARLFAAEGLTEKQTAFTMPELVCAIATSLREGAPAARVLATAEELARLPGIQPLERDPAPGRPERFTTRELLQLEADAIRLALSGRDIDTPRPNRKHLARALLQSPELSSEQRMLVHEASARRDRVVCIVGAAGTGKTTALRIVAEAYRDSGVPVLGSAPSGRAADELEHAAGIASRTLHRLLLDAHAAGGLPHGCLLVVDEAGMAETRKLAPLLDLVERAHGKAILIGDPKQLPPVGAGGLYPALCQRLGAIDLVENHRQRDLTERQALARLRDGDPEPCLSYAARRGRLHLDHDPIAAKQRLLEDWWQAAQHDLTGTVMLAYRRADVRDLNNAARTLLDRAGFLGPRTLMVGEREFRIGDRVICRRNNGRLGIRNGTRATITAIGHDTLTLRTDHDTLRTIDSAYASQHLEHGYALTGHAAQGATLERAFLLLPDRGSLQEWGYVAWSRARAQTSLYLTDHTTEHETHARPLNVDRAPERLARSLTASASEPLSVERLPAADRATVRADAARRRKLEQQKARAQQRLSEAEKQLTRLGWRGRGRRGIGLRTKIAAQRAALRLADEKLAKPAVPTIQHEAILRRSEGPLQHRRPRRTLERWRRLEREGSVGIEL